jgi:hypothetical protein
LIDNAINVTILEIGSYHGWSWLRRKMTFSTTASQEDYNLDEEVDRIVLLRQRTSPVKLLYVPDHIFYKMEPNPEGHGSGTPRYYRLWEETGFSTQNTSAEALQVASSSASDSSAFRVIVEGRESTNNLIVRESFTLNGTSQVTGTTTFAIAGLLSVSKSAQTTGTITIRGATSLTTFSQIAPEERAPRFKRISLYPIPSSAITMYLEYLERIRLLVNDADVPQMDHKWMPVLREGALSKVWGYKQNETAAAATFQIYQRNLELMRRQDMSFADYIPVLQPRFAHRSTVIRVNDSVDNALASYILSPW